jgi:hypothetical protein
LNFYSHAVVAAWHSQNPSFVLGAMLPDLLGMTGLRLREVYDPELARGVALHHATDGAFHVAPVFTSLCGDAIARLTRAGVERGTARAVGHVGVELLLDGALSDDSDARTLYTAALELAVGGGLNDRVALAQPSDIPCLTSGLRRLSRAPIPEAYRDPAVVADRLRAILAPRPRLAMREQDLEPVQTWATDVRPIIVVRRQELLDQVRHAL